MGYSAPNQFGRKLTSKGQVTVPKAIRDALGLRAGSTVRFEVRADGSVDVSIDEIAQGHAELIFPRIEALLTRNGVAYDQLTRIAVTTGPGSFTGLRIGLSAARGLGLARHIPVIGIPSLLAISLGHPTPVAVLTCHRIILSVRCGCSVG